MAEEQSEPGEIHAKAVQTAAQIGVDFYSCEEAVKRLNEYLDHQMSEEDRTVVLKHLEICKPCLTRFSFEQTLIISIRQKITHLCAPQALREKLHGLLRRNP